MLLGNKASKKTTNIIFIICSTASQRFRLMFTPTAVVLGRDLYL